jgi:hypothetical protein
MHCLSCNIELTDVEATRKDLRGKYVDMCNYCLNPIKDDLTFANHFDLNIVEDEEDE